MFESGIFARQLTAAATALADWLLVLLAVYVFVSALDDLAIDALWLRRGLRRRQRRDKRAAQAAEFRPERPIAIGIACWQESGVIGSMLDHNLAVVSYSKFRVLVGVYPNDPETIAAVQAAERRHPKVRMVLLPHAGPTSKADCLNWICAALAEEERASGENFVCFVQHDAEDLVHPLELPLFNARIDEAAFLQLPVLALPTPLHELTHGVYCDDFAESQSKDLRTRALARAFVPGCGVGTALRRDALRLLRRTSGFVFDPRSLTEDYDLGLRLAALGQRQIFLPLLRERGAPVATREYFPRRWHQAVRQRSRWIAGNSLQAWERHGWSGDWRRRWFLWRDRKGLWGNPLSLLCNVLLLIGGVNWVLRARFGGHLLPGSGLLDSPWAAALFVVNSMFLAERLLTRTWVSAGLYGWRFAAGVPIRFVWGNVINAAATFRAVRMWTRAKRHGRRLTWTKTAHAYPAVGNLLARKRALPEICETLGFGPVALFEEALQRRPAGAPATDYLLETGLLTEAQLMEALCLQQSLPRLRLKRDQIEPRVLRSIPNSAAAAWRTVPFRVADGALHLATAEMPSEQMLTELGAFTRLEIRLHLISPREYKALSRESKQRRG